MRVRNSGYFWRILPIALLLGWDNAHAADIPLTTALMEQYKLHVGMKITQENADLIKELVPEAVYRRTKNGEYVFTIGKFETPDLLSKVWDADYYASTENNKGKYSVDSDGGIIDQVSGKRPSPMPLGLPYPDIDLNEDPAKVGTKMMWNVVSLAAACGEQDNDGSLLISGPRNGSYDRYFRAKVLRQYVEFRRNPVELHRPLIFQEIFLE